MSEQELKKYPLWKEAVSEFIKTDPHPGTIISEAWKQEYFGITKPETGTFRVMQEYSLKMLNATESFKTALLEQYQIHLKSIGNGAHIVIPPEEQTREAWGSGVNDVRRVLRKMGNALVNVDIAQLTQDQRKENTDAQVRLAMMTGMFKRARTGALLE